MLTRFLSNSFIGIVELLMWFVVVSVVFKIVVRKIFSCRQRNILQLAVWIQCYWPLWRPVPGCARPALRMLLVRLPIHRIAFCQ